VTIGFGQEIFRHARSQCRLGALSRGEVNAMDRKPKITTGANDRARDETISQTGAGLPDDTSRPVDVDDATVERVRQQLLAGSRQPSEAGDADAVPSGTPGAGENICRRCAGSGEVDGTPCPDCDGTGKVTTPIGGA
jgi:hypothetical protein